MRLRERLAYRGQRPGASTVTRRRTVKARPTTRDDVELTEVYDSHDLAGTVHSSPGDRQAINVHVAPPVPAAPVYRETVVYDDYLQRKVIQAIWLIVGLFEVLLALRFLLRVLAANPENPFAFFIYAITAPLVWPFATLVRAPQSGAAVFEWGTIIAMIVYWLVGWLVTKLIVLFWDRPAKHEHMVVEPGIPVTTDYVQPVQSTVPHDHLAAERLTHVRRTL